MEGICTVKVYFIIFFNLINRKYEAMFKKILKVRPRDFDQTEEDKQYWASRSPIERIEHLEHLQNEYRAIRHIKSLPISKWPLKIRKLNEK